MMVMIHQAIELTDSEGKPTGRWRQTLRANGSPRLEHPVPMCRCENGHESRQAARLCPVVQSKLPLSMREQSDVEPQD